MFAISEDGMFFSMIRVMLSAVILFTLGLVLIWMKIHKNVGKPRKSNYFALLSEYPGTI